MNYEITYKHKDENISYTMGASNTMVEAIKEIEKAAHDDLRHGEAGEYMYYINDQLYR